MRKSSRESDCSVLGGHVGHDGEGSVVQGEEHGGVAGHRAGAVDQGRPVPGRGGGDPGGGAGGRRPAVLQEDVALRGGEG